MRKARRNYLRLEGKIRRWNNNRDNAQKSQAGASKNNWDISKMVAEVSRQKTIEKKGTSD